MEHARTGRRGFPDEQKMVPWILRVGVAGCFIGHGAFGIITKAAWLPYFAIGGVGEPLAWKLMPWIGTMDVCIGVLALVWPCRALFMWAAAWAVWTALCRPLSGEPFWEALERAGNYGVPLALLVLCGWRGGLFARLSALRVPREDARHAALVATLVATTVMLLVGHAGLGFFSHKAGLASHYAALGVGHPVALVPLVGGIEFGLALVVLVFRRPEVFLVACVWKVATESLFLVAGAPVWELIERFGSYTAPLALVFLVATAHAATPVRGPAAPA